MENKTKSIQKLLSFKLVLEHSIHPVSEMKRNKTKQNQEKLRTYTHRKWRVCVYAKKKQKNFFMRNKQRRKP